MSPDTLGEAPANAWNASLRLLEEAATRQDWKEAEHWLEHVDTQLRGPLPDRTTQSTLLEVRARIEGLIRRLLVDLDAAEARLWNIHRGQRASAAYSDSPASR